MAPNKETSGNTQRKRKIPTDEEIADALKRHDGDRKAAAKELEIEPIQIDLRISRAPKTSPLYRGRHSDAEIAKAIRQANGSIKKAAKALGVTPENINRRIRISAKSSPLFKLRGRKTVHQQKFTDEQIAKAIERADRNIKAAAKALQITDATIYTRIRQATSESPLNTFKIETTHYSDHEIAIAIATSDGRIKLAAAELGISTQAIYQRVHGASTTSPLYRHRKRLKGGDIKPELSDKEIVDAIEKSGDSIVKAAEKLGVDRSVIYQRIKRAGEDSPLVEYQGRKRGRRSKYSDHEIAAAIKESDGNLSKTAKTLGLNVSTVSYRIKTAPKDSPLAKYQDIKKGRKPKYSDSAIADAITESDNSISKTAKRLGIHPVTIYLRIQKATEDSPLFKFKKR